MGSPWIRPRSLFSKILMGFYSDWPCNVRAKFEVCSFTHSRDNRGTQKIWTTPGYAHAIFSPKFLTGFYSEWPCKYTPNLKSVALPVPEIRGVAKLQTPYLKEGEAIGGRGCYCSKEPW